MADMDLASRVAAIAAKSKDKRKADEAAAAEQARAKAEQIEQKRAAMREAMPNVADVIDQIRSVFGESVDVLVAEEGGKRVVAEKRLREMGLWHGCSGQ